jgi:hypothetical protein
MPASSDAACRLGTAKQQTAQTLPDKQGPLRPQYRILLVYILGVKSDAATTPPRVVAKMTEPLTKKDRSSLSSLLANTVGLQELGYL